MNKKILFLALLAAPFSSKADISIGIGALQSSTNISTTGIEGLELQDALFSQGDFNTARVTAPTDNNLNQYRYPTKSIPSGSVEATVNYNNGFSVQNLNKPFGGFVDLSWSCPMNQNANSAFTTGAVLTLGYGGGESQVNFPVNYGNFYNLNTSGIIGSATTATAGYPASSTEANYWTATPGTAAGAANATFSYSNAQNVPSFLSMTGEQRFFADLAAQFGVKTGMLGLYMELGLRVRNELATLEYISDAGSENALPEISSSEKSIWNFGILYGVKAKLFVTESVALVASYNRTHYFAHTNTFEMENSALAINSAVDKAVSNTASEIAMDANDSADIKAKKEESQVRFGVEVTMGSGE